MIYNISCYRLLQTMDGGVCYDTSVHLKTNTYFISKLSFYLYAELISGLYPAIFLASERGMKGPLSLPDNATLGIMGSAWQKTCGMGNMVRKGVNQN